MPFGLKNAPAEFQKLTSEVLATCSEFAIPYIDDIIVFSASWERHIGHVREVLTRLREAGLTASPRKCTWDGKVMQFLGHSIGEGRLSIPESRVQAIRNYKRSRSKKSLMTFLDLFDDPCLLRRQSQNLVSSTGQRRGVRLSILFVRWYAMHVCWKYLFHRTSSFS